MIVYLQDEKGNKIDELIDKDGIVEKILPQYNDKNFQCLRFVDLYGDTVFNYLQMNQLGEECILLLNRFRDIEPKEFISHLLSMIKNCKVSPHRYIKFFGD